jgi:hypothetical protein
MEAVAAHANRQPPPPPPSMEAELNKPVMNIRGDQVMISGLFDLKGLRMLEKRIAGLKALMAPDDDEDDEDLVGVIR